MICPYLNGHDSRRNTLLRPSNASTIIRDVEPLILKQKLFLGIIHFNCFLHILSDPPEIGDAVD